MVIYPDNNIIVALEKEKITVDQIKSAVGNSDIIIPFSDAHMYEADTMAAYGSYTKEDLLEKRFQLLDEISKGKYFFTNGNKEILLVERKAKDAYNAIKDFPEKSFISKGFQENMSNEYRKLYRNVFGLEDNVINSMPIEKIIPYLDNQLKQAGTNSFSELLLEAQQTIKEKETISLYDEIAMRFALLDLMGFYRDAETDKSDFARMWDSYHASYATKTDVFLSNDKRARKKTEVVYYLLNIEILVIGM